MSNLAFEQAIAQFLSVIESGGNSDEEAARMMDELDQYAPHSELSGIIFYGERFRTPRQMAEEAVLREELWNQGGAMAVAAHIEASMRAALADPEVRGSYRSSAARILEDIERKAARKSPQ